MTRIVRRLSDRALALFLPEREAGACACSPADGHYEYRCALPAGWQRRWCSYNCNCVKSCGSWVTIVPRGCP
jgi:hypothetical protein